LDNDIMVSILCTAYNHQNFIEDAMKGFIMQKTDFKYEALVHDDASTDKTAEIIIEYSKKYPEIIKPIIQKENQYSKGDRIYSTFLYPLAKGKYIAICEGDDLWTDEYKLQKQIDFLREHPECSMCYHAASIHNVMADKEEGLIRPYRKTCIIPDKTLFFGGGDDVPTASICFVKELALDVPQFALDSPVGDHPLVLLLSYRGRVGYIDEVMSVRNLWVPNSWNTDFNLKGNIEKRTMHLRAMIELLSKYNIYTNHKFEDQIRKRVLAGEIEIRKLQGQDPFTGDKVRALLKTFNRLMRLKLWISCKLPAISNLYSKIKKRVCDLSIKRI